MHILCCPEDIHCHNDVAHSRHTCCTQRVAPLCIECENSLQKRMPEIPKAALTNDMMIFYAPTELYKLQATVMEMICASVCITSMICFTLEKTCRNHRHFDEQAHANLYRMVCRGNAASFPLPWHDLLQQLQTYDDEASSTHRVVLPRTGEDLANVVSVLLQTADSKDSDKDLARLVHQATVRRHVVVQLISSMKKRGHRGYKHVVMKEVRRRAHALPTDGVPPEIIKLLPLDKLLDKIQIQKSATPIPTPQNEHEAAANLDVTRINGVVLEKSSQEEIDVQAQCNAALQNLLRQLKATPLSPEQFRAQRVEVKTGNEMLDQYQPFLFWCCISFYF